MTDYVVDENAARSGDVLLPWVEFYLTPPGGGAPKLYRWSDVPASLASGFIEPRILSWVRIVRALADDYNQYENQQFGWTTSDYNRELLDIMNDPEYKYWWNQLCTIKLISVPRLRAGDNPMIVAKGVIRDVNFDPERKLTFTAEDVFSTEFSITFLDEQLPRRKILKGVFPDCPAGATDAEGTSQPAIVGLPEPIIYGRVSDGDFAPEWQHGVCPGLPVGTEDIGGNPSWVRVLVASHACKEIEAVYLAGVRQPNERLGTDILVPGWPNWPFPTTYRDIAGRRYTLVYVIGPAANAIMDGSAPMTLDVKGVESVGDGSGALITDIFDQFRHFLTNFAFANYQIGPWLATPAYTDGTPLIDTASFDLAKFLRGVEGGGIVGANGDFRTKQEWIGAWNISADSRTGWDRFGRFTITSGEQQPPKLTFTESENIIRGTFQMDPELDKLRNTVVFNYQRNWAGGYWGVRGECVAVDSVDKYKMRRPDSERDFWFLRHSLLADSCITHFIHRKMHPPRRVTFETTLHGLQAELGTTVKVIHSDGSPAGLPGTSGIAVMVERWEVDPAIGVARFTGWDYETLDPFPPKVLIYPLGADAPGGNYSYGSGSAPGGPPGAGGVEEVYVGPEDPGAQIELWYDVDATSTTPPSGGGASGVPAFLGGSRSVTRTGAGPIAEWVPVILDRARLPTGQLNVYGEFSIVYGGGTCDVGLAALNPVDSTWTIIGLASSGIIGPSSTPGVTYFEFVCPANVGRIGYRLEVLPSNPAAMVACLGSVIGL